MKLEGIVLAAGSGSRMVELTRGRPKCLLPVGNQSLIWFAITGLRSVGVSKIIVLIPDIHETDIKQYCHKKFNSFKDLDLEFIPVSTKADCGTAESILSIRDKIRGDFIVHSCDTIVDPKALLALVNHYRLYDPMMSMLLADNPQYFQSRSVPGRLEKEYSMRDIIALEPMDKLDLTASDGYCANKVVFLRSERNIKQELKIRSRELALHPSLGVYSRFLDTHIYIFKRQMLDFMAQNSDRAVLKGEVIPLLVSRQFNKVNDCDNTDQMEDDDDDKQRATNNYEEELKEKLECFNPQTVVKSTHFRRINLPIPSSCHALTTQNTTAYRVNTIGSYLDSNCEAKTILSKFGAKNLPYVKECLIGENLTVGAKCVIKRGSIGNNCKIGDKVQLIDCVISDSVEIESNTSLKECIVGANAKIGGKCDLKSCIIGSRQVVPNGRKSNSEVIIDDGYVIDLSDPLIKDSE